ncbi:MAG TPA: GGDEF domain-containing protein [Candidatus Limnocylindria bacterium]|nr:GGDEF domain-containing protein [Candidatus Limnocylindria bacterium]
METEPLVVLAIVDALLVAMFFLFRVLPWAKPGPWRAIWLVASLTSFLFIAAELVALAAQGTALSLEHQVPLFGAIFAVTAGFILTYLGGQRVTERALTLAETDELTQLGNARAFDLHLSDLGHRRTPFALVYLDVDGLKKVNDTRGHAAGDRALQDVAAVLRGSLRQTDLAARLGGDEFALLLPGADPAIARAIAERVIAGLTDGPAPERRVGASIGIVPEAQRFTTTEAVRKADTAMYASKTAGGSRITIAEG